jgi:heptosyltransferase III
LHIAAALGIRSIGLYTPQRPMHPGRWAPLGRDTRVLVASEHPAQGQKLAISIEAVIKAIEVE